MQSEPSDRPPADEGHDPVVPPSRDDRPGSIRPLRRDMLKSAAALAGGTLAAVTLGAGAPEPAQPRPAPSNTTPPAAPLEPEPVHHAQNQTGPAGNAAAQKLDPYR